MFWKKKEDPILDNPNDYGSDDSFDTQDAMPMDEPMGMQHASPDVPERPTMPLGQPMPESLHAMRQGYDQGMNRDTELILAKLDAIKARVESMDARLSHIEKLAEEE